MYVGFMDPQAAESPAMHMTSSFQSPRPTRKAAKLAHTINPQTINGGTDMTESPP